MYSSVSSVIDFIHISTNEYLPLLNPLETISMKCQILFSGENKTNISLCRLLKILSSVLSVNADYPYHYLSQRHISIKTKKDLSVTICLL